MLSRFTVSNWRQGLWAAAGLWALGILVALPQLGLLALGLAVVGAVAGLLGGGSVLGFTLVFNPLCQDRCMVAVSLFFAVAGLAMEIVYVIAIAGAAVPIEEGVLSLGAAAGIAAVAWLFARSAAARIVQRIGSHAV